MNIGVAAKRASLPPKTIRYYEEIDLIRPERGNNGYRRYDERDVNRLRFLQRARGLGFTIDECRQLLSLYDDENRSSADVKAMATGKIAEIERKIAALESLKGALAELCDHCDGDHRPDCPIIDELAGRRDR